MTENLLEADDQANETQSYFDKLVGEGRKFKDQEELAKGKDEADSYIKIMEKRFDELSEDYTKLREESIAGQKLQDLIDKLESQQQLTQSEPPSMQKEVQAAPPVDVEAKITSAIQKHEQTKKESENFSKTRDKLKEVFGTEFQTTLNQKAQALGLTTDDINFMARRNPDLFFKTFDLNQSKGEGFQSPPRSNTRSDNFAPTNNTKAKNWAYYQELKKKDPMAWMDKKVAVQMEKDAQALGADFYK